MFRNSTGHGGRTAIHNTFMFIHTAGDKLSYTCVLNTLTQRLYHVVVHSEKMASKTKRSRPNRIRHRIETECETEAEKEALARRLDRVRQLLTPPGSRGIDNGTMLNAMFDIVEREAVEGAPASRPHMASEGQPLTQSFMRNSGENVEDTYTVATKAISSITCARYKMYKLYTCGYGQGIYTILYGRYDVSTCLCIGIYTADTTPADSKLFIGEYHALSDLLDGLKTPCSCGMSSHPWVMESVIQVCSFIYYLLICTRITTNDVSVIAVNFVYRRGM